MKIKRLPSGNYHAITYSYTDANGKRHYESFTASEKAEVMRQVAEFKQTKKREGYPLEMNIRECIDRYITSKENVLSPTTLLDYRARQRLYFDKLNDIKLRHINKEILQNFVNDLSKNLSPKSVRNVYGLLIASIRMFSDHDFHVTMPAKKPVERNIPTDKDVKDLLDRASQNMKKAILLASVGTLRRGEVCGLKYKDINKKGNTIYVHTDMVKGINGWEHKENPKTSSSTRYITLPKQVIKALGDGDPEEYVCPITPMTITKTFSELRDSLGLKCRFHDLRHYAASIMHAIGCSDAFIMERGGWSNDATLKSVYRHSLSDKADEFTEAANNYFQNTLLK